MKPRLAGSETLLPTSTGTPRPTDARLQIHGISERHFIRHRDDSHDAKATGEVCLQSHAVYRRAVRNPRFIKCDRFKPTTLDDVCNRTSASANYPRSQKPVQYSDFRRAPLQRSCRNGTIPKTQPFLVKQRQRDGKTSHIERGHVGSYQ